MMEKHQRPYEEPSLPHDDTRNDSVFSLDSSANSKVFTAECNTLDQCQTVWNPIWLQLRTLCSFAALFALCTCATLVLFFVSIKNHGLATQAQSHRFFWTYGPTAGMSSSLGLTITYTYPVLVSIASMWWRVDYWTKLLLPWDRLRAGPVSAQRSLLADYLSPIVPEAIYRASRTGDGAVVASGLAYMALKFAVRLTLILMF